MNNLFKDLLIHQSWADSIHWKMFELLPEIFKNTKMWERIFHIHQVQHAYLNILKGQEGEFKKIDDFLSPAELKKYAALHHIELIELIETFPQEKYSDKITVPWVKVNMNFEQAIIHLTTHSHYHRGQNAALFRELGGEPQTIDYLIWVWKNRPAPEWKTQEKVLSV